MDLQGTVFSMVGSLLQVSVYAEQRKLRRSVSLIFVSLMVVLGVKAVNAQSRNSLTPCKIGHEAPATGFWTWASNARVQVYIRSADFDPEQLPYLLTALSNWNSVSEETGSGVKFEYQGNTVQQRSCENCLTILRDRVFDKTKRHATEIRAYSARDNQIITYATIVVDPVLTNPRALLNALVHELGHNLGLLDCYTCKRKSTVMNQFEAVNVPNDMEKPTSCDIAQVKQAYKELRVLVRASPPDRGSMPEDEGEEPVEDDTPVVIPTPVKRPAGQVR
jgi:hypothetical protein